MFSQSPRQFSSGQDPWFRIGTVDIGTTGVVSLVVLFGVLLSAAEGAGNPVSAELAFFSSDVTSGEIWRLVTWWVASVSAFSSIISAAVIFFIGGQIEGALGRVRMAKFVGVLILIFPLAALALYIVGFKSLGLAAADEISRAMFYTLILLRPGIRFLFGIPAWVLGAVFFVIELLDNIEARDGTRVLFMFLTLGLVFLTAKAFGLANDIPWIPDIRRVSSGASGGASPFSGGTSSRSASSGGRLRRPSRKTPVRPPVVGVDSSFEDMGIDEILDQISAFGIESLNSAQRKKLDAYSKGKKKDK